MRRHAFALALAGALAAGPVAAQGLDLTLSGASPGGLWSLLGAGIDRAAKAEDEASVVTYQTTGGGFANIGLLEAGRTDLGLAHDAEVKIALAGEAPFEAPAESLRAIGYLYNWAPMHFFVTTDAAEEYGLESLSDVAEARAPLTVAVNKSGNITSNVALSMLEEAGVTEAALEEWGGELVQAGSKEQANLIQDGRIDMVTNGIFVGHSSFRKIDEEVDVKLLSIAPEIVEATNAKFGTQAFTIPAESYSDQPGPVETSALGAMLLTTADADEDTIHRLTTAMIEHVDQIAGVHKSMNQLDAELMASQSALPFHPAAERAYKEADLIE